MRQFAGGASRDTDDNKADPEGCFHPLVIREVSEYMKRHSYLPDGSRRPADNWQFGMPRAVWRKSLERHWLDVRLHDKGHSDKAREPIIDALCAVIFNAQGRLLEELLGRDLQVDSKRRKRPSTVKPHVALTLNPDGTLSPTPKFLQSDLVSGPITAALQATIHSEAKKLVKEAKKRYPVSTRRKK